MYVIVMTICKVQGKSTQSTLQEGLESCVQMKPSNGISENVFINILISI